MTVVNDASYTLKTISTITEIESIREIWKSMQYHPNADVDFYLTILDSRKDTILRPHIIVLYSYNIPKAMIIGRIDLVSFNVKLGYKTLFSPTIKALTVIYGGIQGDLSEETANILINHMRQSLKRGEADVVHFNNIHLNSIIYKYAIKNPHFFCRDRIILPSLHWMLSIPGTIDLFYNKMTSKHRYWLKRLPRVLEKDFPGETVVETYSDSADVNKLCLAAEQIAKKTYHRGLGVGFIDNDENRRRLLLSAKNGWLKALVLYIKKQPCAFWICTNYKKVFHLNFTAYDPQYKKYEPGTILFLKMIEALCHDKLNSKVDNLDFGFGNALYKERFGDLNWQEAYVYIYAPTIKGIMLNFLRTSNNLLILIVDKILRKMNVREKLKKIWRQKLTKNVSA